MQEKNIESNRRNFFSLVSKGLFGLAVISILPKTFRNIREKKMIDVKIHPSAIKRGTK